MIGSSKCMRASRKFRICAAHVAMDIVKQLFRQFDRIWTGAALTNKTKTLWRSRTILIICLSLIILVVTRCAKAKSHAILRREDDVTFQQILIVRPIPRHSLEPLHNPYDRIAYFRTGEFLLWDRERQHPFIQRTGRCLPQCRCVVRR